MNTNRLKRLHRISSALLLVGLFALSFYFCSVVESHSMKKSAEMLEVFKDSIVQKLKGTYNYASDMALAMSKDDSDESFNTAARQIMRNEGCLYVEFYEDRRLTRVYPRDSSRGHSIGKYFKDLNRAYSLARLRRGLVVEGPIEQEGQEVFISIQPILATDGAEYTSEVAVAMDAEMVLSLLNLDLLAADGYEYELWRLNPDDGSKDTVSTSSDTADFSDAIEVRFELPTLWTLSILPVGGWYPFSLSAALWAASVAVAAMFALTLRLYRWKLNFEQADAARAMVDVETGMPNRLCLAEKLNEWTASPDSPFALIYIVIDDYNRFAQTATPLQRLEQLEHTVACLDEYVKSEHISARVGEGNYILAIREALTDTELDNIQKGLAIEMIWKYFTDGGKAFISARSVSCRFPGNATNPDELLELVTAKFFTETENFGED